MFKNMENIEQWSVDDDFKIICIIVLFKKIRTVVPSFNFFVTTIYYSHIIFIVQKLTF